MMEDACLLLAYVVGFFVTLYVRSFLASRHAIENDTEPKGLEGDDFMLAMFWVPLAPVALIFATFKMISRLSDRHAKSLYPDKPSKHGDRVEFPDEPIQ